MNNVGDIKTFTMYGTHTDGLTYVWKWWDGSIDATLLPTTTKRLNIGGDPRWSGTLPVEVEVVDHYGKSGVYNTSIVVNNPPQIVAGSAGATPNGQLITYDTILHATAYDLEGHGMSFSWEHKGLLLGAGSGTYAGQVDAYWNGTYVGQASGTTVTFSYPVEGSTNVTLTVTDAEGGETEVDFPVYGFQRSDVYFAPSAGPESQTGDASSEPIVTAGEDAAFTVYSAAASPGRTAFVWGFWGTNGWTFPSSSNGATSILPDGTTRNVVMKATAGETPGNKLAEVTIYDLDTNTFAIVTVPVLVVSNDPPEAASYEVKPEIPLAGQMLRFTANYTDPNRDLVTTRWQFSSPAAVAWGRTVFVSTAGMNPGDTVGGKFTVYDRLGYSDEISFSFTLG